MISTTSRLISIGSATLIGAGGFFLRVLTEKRNQTQSPDLDQELVDKITKSNQDLTVQVEELKSTLVKLMDEMKEFLLRSQAGAIKKIAITSSILITAGVVLTVAFVPGIQRRVHRWVKSESIKTQIEPREVSNVNQNRATTINQVSAETQTVVFLVSPGSDPLRNDIQELQHSVSHALQNLLPHVSIQLVGDLNDFLEPVALVFRFELVDDRISELKKKVEESEELFSRTNQNCVWIFNCFKPNELVAGTAIHNTVNGMANFKSGYLKKNGAKISTWLRYEYVVEATPDHAGNLAHRLTDKEKMRDNIVKIIRDSVC